MTAWLLLGLTAATLVGIIAINEVRGKNLVVVGLCGIGILICDALLLFGWVK